MRTSLLVVLALVLAACGQKGPLYLPDEEPEPAPAVEAGPAGEDEDDDRER